MPFLSLFFAALPIKAHSQFTNAQTGYQYKFPKDHGAHPDFASEWWYYTGNLRSPDGKQAFGYQLTFFRIGLQPDGKAIYAAHLALSDLKKQKFYFFDRLNPAILDKAGTKPGLIWNKNWQTQIKGKTHQLQAKTAKFSLNLQLCTTQDPIIQGKAGEGISRKGNCASCASHYYSIPRLKTTGKIGLADQSWQVQGLSWMDHEFGSNQLADDQTGWDWFSLHLADGSSLMIYQLRSKAGTASNYANGTLIKPNGEQVYLSKEDFNLQPLKTWRSPHTKAIYPLSWHLHIPKHKINLTVQAQMADQELQTQNSTDVSYWEGSVKVLQDQKNAGEGYMELTGYAETMSNKF
jgi:predicted secreted hydrolase